ncbi:hypothetical protein PG985_008496 [Apiospora marii]|uniref:uncharacterized protein n=1 Tax=Apiospora marii TaxID=335849 RepID=UPI00312E41E3
MPNHIVQHILRFLQHNRPEDVLTVAEVCHFLHEQARYVQHHLVCVDLVRDQHLGVRLDLIQHHNLLQAVRELRVERTWFEVPNEDYRKTLSRLVEMTPRMTGLRDLHWNVSRQGTTEGVPKALLDKLPPQLRLHTSFFHWCHTPERGSAQFRRALACLVGNRNLYSLCLSISVEQGEECAETMSVLKDVLLSCPNLRRIPQLRTGWCHHMCETYPLAPMASYAGLGFAGGERPAAAWEELGLGEYMWPSVGMRLTGNRVLGGWGSRGYPIDAGPEETYWAETFDWTRLERLHYSLDCHFPPVLFSKLVGLREFRLEHDWNQATYEEDAIARLDDIVSPLEVLALPRLNDEQMRNEVTRWLGAIVRHGSTLRSLTMHTKNWCSWRDPDRGMTERALQLLLPDDETGGGLPRLEELSLDLAWDEDGGGWPYRALDVIARFPCLRRIELWFRLRRGYLHAHPHLTVAAARHLAGYLRQRNPRLQRLVLRSGLGEWRATPHRTVSQQTPVPRSKLNWIDLNCVSFVCEFVEPPLLADANDDASIIITCPELSREMNWRLRSFASSSHNDDDEIHRRERLVATDLDQKTLPLKVALDGPLWGAEWKAWCDQHQLDGHETTRDRGESILPEIAVVRPWGRALRHLKDVMGLVRYVLRR